MSTKHRLDNASINLSLCLDDMKKSGKIKKASNGKLYIDITIRAKKGGKDEYGKDLYAFASPTKEERETANKDGVQLELTFVGNGSLYEFSESVQEMAEAPTQEVDGFFDDLPF